MLHRITSVLVRPFTATPTRALSFWLVMNFVSLGCANQTAARRDRKDFFEEHKGWSELPDCQRRHFQALAGPDGVDKQGSGNSTGVVRAPSKCRVIEIGQVKEGETLETVASKVVQTLGQAICDVPVYVETRDIIKDTYRAEGDKEEEGRCHEMIVDTTSVKICKLSDSELRVISCMSFNSGNIFCGIMIPDVETLRQVVPPRLEVELHETGLPDVDVAAAFEDGEGLPTKSKQERVVKMPVRKAKLEPAKTIETHKLVIDPGLGEAVAEQLASIFGPLLEQFSGLAELETPAMTVLVSRVPGAGTDEESATCSGQFFRLALFGIDIRTRKLVKAAVVWLPMTSGCELPEHAQEQIRSLSEKFAGELLRVEKTGE